MLTPSPPAPAHEAATTRGLPRRVIWGLGAMITLTFIGVIDFIGFMLVAAVSPLDALSMTVVTFSTVGYNVIVPLDQGGRIFPLALIIAGIGTIGYTGAVTVEYLVSGHRLARVAKRRKEQALTALRDHYIVCGFGRVGEGIIENLGVAGRSVVTIDRDPTRCEHAEGLGVPAVCGNAASSETLRAAGMELLDVKSKDMTIEEVATGAASANVDRTIGNVGLRQQGVEVMAIGRDGEQQSLPARDETARAQDVLVMIGPPPNVRQFAEQADQ